MNIYKLRKGTKFLEVLKFCLVYGYINDKENEDGSKDGITLNQEVIAKFFNMSKRNMIRMFNIMRENKFIIQYGKKRFKSLRKQLTDTTIWKSNLYTVEIEAINKYFIETTGYDVVENMDTELYIYDDFIRFVEEDYKKAIAQILENSDKSKKDTSDDKTEDNADNNLYDKKLKMAKKLETKIKNKKKQIDKKKKENAKYTKLLLEVNDGSYVKSIYLDEDRRRLTNVVCTTKNPKKHSDDKLRYKFLTKQLGVNSGDIEEFDTNASIYRLSYSLGHGELLNHEADLYELIYNECGFEPKFTNELRNQFKQLLMPIYMKEQSIHYRSSEFEKQSKWKSIYDKAVEKKFLFNKQFVTLFKKPLIEILETIRKAMYKVFNIKKFYKADIFIHESNLHILMLKKFKDMGVKTINVYDGFYFVRGTMTKDLYYKVYDEATMELLEDCRKNDMLFI